MKQANLYFNYEICKQLHDEYRHLHNNSYVMLGDYIISFTLRLVILSYTACYYPSVIKVSWIYGKLAQKSK